MILFRILTIIMLISEIAVGSLQADIKPNALISDGMVLQQKELVKIWGTGAPNEKVTVTFRDQTVSTVCGADGNWLLQLQSKTAGGPFPMTLTGNNTINLPNVYVGEVWLLSGQSNMEYALWHCVGGPEAIANSTNPQLRLITIPHTATETPQSDVTASWVEANPTSTKNFSAVGYWFGSKLQKQLGVPVGLINDVWGGTAIESWLSRDVLDNLPTKTKDTDYDTVKAAYDALIAQQKPIKDKYDQDVADALKHNLPKPVMPHLAGPLRGPSMLYNGMIAPIENYTIKGVVWYQGESNAYVGRANSYSMLLPKLIELWRAKWGQGDFPFIIPQITPNRKPIPNLDPNTPSGIAVIREAQFLALKEPNTALVVTTDLADADGDVHYKRKEPTGQRIELAAMALAYGFTGEYSGPLYQDVKFEGGKATISFTHLGGGLVSKDGPLTGFAIAGADKKFVAAEAVIDGDKVVVSSPSVADPASVRYGWADNPVPTLNLWNKAELPASPFRTDNWDLPGEGAVPLEPGQPGVSGVPQNIPPDASTNAPPK
jgi:sialate O-acetylesterase